MHDSGAGGTAGHGEVVVQSTQGSSMLWDYGQEQRRKVHNHNQLAWPWRRGDDGGHGAPRWLR